MPALRCSRLSKSEKVSQTILTWTKLVCYRCSAHYVLGERAGSGEGRLEHILKVTRKPIEWLIVDNRS